MTSSLDKAGHSFSYSYEDLNRLTQMTASDQALTCSYEANGLLKTRRDAQGTTSYSYEILQREIPYLNRTGPLFGKRLLRG